MPDERPQVIVSVEGGIAEVTVVRGDVEVLQWDWDVIEEADDPEWIEDYIERAERLPDDYPHKADILAQMRLALKGQDAD